MDVCSVAGGVGEGRKDTSHHTAPPLPIMVSRQRSGASCPNLTTVCEVASMDKPPKVSSASRLPPTLISRKHSTPAYTRRMQMVSSIRTAAPTTPLLGRVHFYINPALGQDCSSVRLRRHVSNSADSTLSIPRRAQCGLHATTHRVNVPLASIGFSAARRSAERSFSRHLNSNAPRLIPSHRG